MKKLLLALLLVFPAMTAIADDKPVVINAPNRLKVIHLEKLPALKITGVVVVKKSKLRNAAIVDDQIIWEGDFYKVKGETTDLKVIKIEIVNRKGQVTFQQNGDTFVRMIKKR